MILQLISFCNPHRSDDDDPSPPVTKLQTQTIGTLKKILDRFDGASTFSRSYMPSA